MKSTCGRSIKAKSVNHLFTMPVNATPINVKLKPKVAVPPKSKMEILKDRRKKLKTSK